MSGYEFEDDKGNRYRITKGAGHGYVHPENIGAGSTLVASDIFRDVPFESVAGAGNHFWFDVLSKIPDLPLPPKDALSTAVAGSYLTVEKLDTALAVDDDVADTRPILRIQIQQALTEIIAGERAEAAMHQRQMDKEGAVTKGLIYTGAFMQGIGSSAWGAVLWAKEVSDLVNPVVLINQQAKAIQEGWESDSFYDKYRDSVLTAQKRELVEVLGFDPTSITEQQIDEAIAMAQLVLDDPTLRDMLYRFVKDYAEAQHAIEVTEVAGSGAFELILTIILAAATGGVGVVAAVGSKTALIRKFRKVGDSLSDFAKVSRKLKLQGKKRKANTGKADFKNFEVVDYQTRKTDSRGPHRDTDSQSREDSAPKNKDTVFSGHGSYEPSRGSVVVPEGTSITVYSKPGATITNDLGMEIEKGTDLSRVYKERYMPGDELPDYMLHSPDGLEITGSPVTVTQDTPLSELLKPNMGECHWAACTYNSQAPTSNLVYDSDGVIDESLEDYVTIYNK